MRAAMVSRSTVTTASAMARLPVASLASARLVTWPGGVSARSIIA